MVAFVSGEIVAVTDEGKITILSQDLIATKELDRTGSQPQSLFVNSYFLVCGDLNGGVWYQKRNSDAESKVRALMPL